MVLLISRISFREDESAKYNRETTAVCVRNVAMCWALGVDSDYSAVLQSLSNAMVGKRRLLVLTRLTPFTFRLLYFDRDCRSRGCRNAADIGIQHFTVSLDLERWSLV